MSFGLGIKALRRFVEDDNPYAYFKAKVDRRLFKGEVETQVFEFVDQHFHKYRQLPQLETLTTKFPEIKDYQAPEPVQYYLDKLSNRYGYQVINAANLKSQELLKANPDNIGASIAELQKAIAEIVHQQHRTRLLDFGQDGPELVMSTYNNSYDTAANAAQFGWEYMDDTAGGAMPGDLISFVGRPATGKSWLTFRVGLHNWRALHKNVLCVSMEMNTLQVAQRLAAMYAGTNISQLKVSGYSSQTFQIFHKAMKGVLQEPGKMYVVDGNLAVSADEIFILADQLKCNVVLIDGAYLLRHKNPRLGRYERVAENAELMKTASTDLEIPTFASWQFSREAAKKKAKKQKEGLEDIGYSDVIGQISTIVLALMQEEGVETLHQRIVDVMKGRNGEIGQFRIKWDFNVMGFDQVQEEEQAKPLNFI